MDVVCLSQETVKKFLKQQRKKNNEYFTPKDMVKYLMLSHGTIGTNCKKLRDSLDEDVEWKIDRRGNYRYRFRGQN